MTLEKIYELATQLNRVELFDRSKMEMNIEMSVKEANDLEYQLELRTKGISNKSIFKPTKNKEYNITINGVTFNIIKKI